MRERERERGEEKRKRMSRQMRRVKYHVICYGVNCRPRFNWRAIKAPWETDHTQRRCNGDCTVVVQGVITLAVNSRFNENSRHSYFGRASIYVNCEKKNEWEVSIQKFICFLIYRSGVHFLFFFPKKREYVKYITLKPAPKQTMHWRLRLRSGDWNSTGRVISILAQFVLIEFNLRFAIFDAYNLML